MGRQVTKKRETYDVNPWDPAARQGRLKGIGGSDFDTFNNVVANQAIQSLWLAHAEGEDKDRLISAGVGALIGIGPKDEIEGMLAAQMLAVHSASMECFRRGMIKDQTFAGRQQSLAHGGKPKSGSSANVGFENKLWAAADALRNNMDAAEYKHVVLGLIFLKYISDAFEAKHAELEAQKGEGADPEDPDEYRAQNIFWTPPEARWTYLKSQAPQPTIGKLIDDAMAAIERDNPSLKDVLPKEFGRLGLDKERLGQIINLISDIALGDPAERAKDKLGQVYEYFLRQFASAEGKNGGQFYTPSSVVRVLVEMLAPYKGRVDGLIAENLRGLGYGG
jgi:hypothetical protein